MEFFPKRGWGLDPIHNFEVHILCELRNFCVK